jgi:hypothetical protein
MDMNLENDILDLTIFGENNSISSFNDNLLITSTYKNQDLDSKNDNLGNYLAEKVINANKAQINEINSDIKSNVKPNDDENINKKNKNLFNVYRKKEHTKYNRDNLKDKIIRCFLNNIIFLVNYEITKIKNLNNSFFNNKLIEKITSISIFFQKIKIEELFKLKTKNIFYTDEILKIFKLNKKELTEKYKQKKKENNKNNKIIIKKIEEEKENIQNIKNEIIKKSILNLSEIMDKTLYEMYIFYLTNDNHFEGFKTIIDDKIKLEKEGENEKYLGNSCDVAKSLINNIDEKLDDKINLKKKEKMKSI